MKRGSALLIVLGMISFLVISAVAFSAYMRYQRLPSSYLRRTSSSRLLAKAALAQAIDRLDIALGNDPFAYSLGFEYNQGSDYAGEGYDCPRVTDAQSNAQARRDRRNFWRSHCFIGTNTLVLANDTVSTLTLEGLAYLPPALINEARYYSRHADSARWRNFGFDMGRYAYFAVDVSDHIDINRVFADMGRNSSDRGRITLAHVFEKPNHDGYEGSPSPQAWDSFMDQYLRVDDIKDGLADAYRDPSKLPLVSLADLNLAINDKQSGWVQKMSPFCYEVSPATRSRGSEYVRAPNSAEGVMQRQMAFVTDSYFPSTNTSATADLAFVQPFTDMEKSETGRQRTLEEIIPQSTAVSLKLKDNLSGLDIISLYDYLDGNDIPASLALPTTERVPMICGLSPTAVFQMKLEKMLEGGFNPESQPEAAIADGTVRLVEHQFLLKLDGPKTVDVDALCLFPFHRNKEADEGVNYTVDFAVRIGLTPRGKPHFRAPTQSAFVVPDKADFQKNAVENGVIKLYKQANGTPKNTDVQNESQVTKKVSASFDLGDAENFFNNNPLFTITHKYVAETISQDPLMRRWRDDGPAAEKPPTVSNAFYPLAEDGRGLLSDFSIAKLLDGTAAAQVSPFMTVSARVKTSRTAGGAETVDLVPASVYDDNAFNNVNNLDVISLGGDANSRPLVSVVDVGGNATLTFGDASWNGTFTAQLKPASNGGAFICPDPRWNFAPENFYLIDQQLQEGNWFPDLCGVENQQRDCDIFMSVSNQGYLQSLAEIAMLPRTCIDFGGGDQMLGDAGGRINVSANRDRFETWPGKTDNFAALPHGFLMWRTYRLFAHDGLLADPIYDMDIVNTGTGFRLNPFTTSSDIMMAALANTPVSWWAASTNFTVAGKTALDGLGAEDFNKDYAFNAMATKPNAKLYWKDLKNVAAKLMGAMRRTDGNWAAGFDGLNWDYDDGLCDVSFADTDPDILKDVDRKFLYGFWRECFANRQQLFLVFVRAEPTMMGGGAVGATPPSLGARAVALVWRDPTPTPKDVGNGQPRPHRTRVLFYRQFD